MKYLIIILIFIQTIYSLNCQTKESKDFNETYFIENKGQWDSKVKFFTRSDGQNIWLTDTSLIIQSKNNIINSIPFETSNFEIIKLEKLPQYYNFFLGNDSNRWKSYVPCYKKLLFTVNKDTVISLTKEEKQLKINYKSDNDFHSRLYMQLPYSSYLGGSSYDVAESVKIDDKKNVYVCGYTSSVNFPTSDSAFSRELKNKEYDYPDIFVSKFDSTGKELIFSTYIGGMLDDFAKALEVDAQYNIFVSGYTGPTRSFPTTSGAYDTLYNGGYDSYVIKLNSSGSKLLYCTLIGGEKDDYTQGMSIDKSGNAYIIGYTTGDGNYPVSPNAYQKTYNGKYDVFISKFNSTGSTLLYSTYFGGNEDDFGQDIVVDNSNIAYFVGFTRSSNLPTTTNAFSRVYKDTAESDNRSDVFWGKLSADGSALNYSTYLGGKAKDAAYSIYLDKLNNVYLTGTTESSEFPITAGAYDTVYHKPTEVKGDGDIFISKFNNDGTNLIFSTFLGGSSTDRGYAICVDSLFNSYVTGTTSSKNFPMTKGAFKTILKDSAQTADAFLAKIDSSGSRLIYSSFLGGSRGDVGKALINQGDLFVWVVGTTSSKDFMTTADAFGPNCYDSDSTKTDCFISKILPYYVEAIFDKYPTDTSATSQFKNACAGKAVKMGVNAEGGYGSLKYHWQPETSLDNPDLQFPTASPKTTTVYTVTISDQSIITITATSTVNIYQLPQISISGPSIVLKNSKQYYSTIYDSLTTYLWTVEGGTITTGQGTNNIQVQWNDSSYGKLRVYLEHKYGCKDSSKDAFIVRIGDYFKPELKIIYGSTKTCAGDSLIVDGGKGYIEYKWSDGNTSRYDTIKKAGKYWLVVKDELGFYGYSDTITVVILSTPAKPNIIYHSGTLQCLTPLPNYQWYWNGNVIESAVLSTYKPLKNGYYRVATTGSNGCKGFSDSIYVNDTYIIENDSKTLIISYDVANMILRIDRNGELGIFSLSIFDLLGNEYFKANFNPDDAAQIIELNLSKYPKGLYFIGTRSYSGTGFIKILVE